MKTKPNKATHTKTYSKDTVFHQSNDKTGNVWSTPQWSASNEEGPHR